MERVVKFLEAILGFLWNIKMCNVLAQFHKTLGFVKEMSTVKELEKNIGVRWTYRIFRIVRFVYMIVDLCLSKVTGYSLVNGWKSERINGSGHLVKIIERSSENPAGQNFLHNFILKHDSYIDSTDYVLQNDFVTLMGASETHVWFCVSPNFNVYNLKLFSYAFMAQFQHAEKLLIVDMTTAIEIASKMEGPQGNCIMINNTGRCSSKLLCQVSV